MLALQPLDIPAALTPAAVHRPCFIQRAAAAELSEEQQLVVDAWLAVSRGFVDSTYNGLDWKAVRSDYVKRSYKSMNAARDGVRQMLSKLDDRYTRYLTPSAFEAIEQGAEKETRNARCRSRRLPTTSKEGAS